MINGFKKNVVVNGYEFTYVNRFGFKKKITIDAESIDVAMMEMESLQRIKHWKEFSFKSFIINK